MMLIADAIWFYIIVKYYTTRWRWQCI